MRNIASTANRNGGWKIRPGGEGRDFERIHGELGRGRYGGGGGRHCNCGSGVSEESWWLSNKREI